MLEGLLSHPILAIWLALAVIAWLILFSASKASDAN